MNGEYAWQTLAAYARRDTLLDLMEANDETEASMMAGADYDAPVTYSEDEADYCRYILPIVGTDALA